VPANQKKIIKKLSKKIGVPDGKVGLATSCVSDPQGLGGGSRERENIGYNNGINRDPIV
jgi:hypothetical protein